MKNRIVYTGLTDALADEKDAIASHAEKHISFEKDRITVTFDGTADRIITDVDLSSCRGDAARHRAKAVWDTGSLTSCISVKFAEEIGLEPVEEGIGISSTGQTKIFFYYVDVSLSEELKISKIKAGGFPMPGHDADFIIGMDIIGKGKFHIENIGGKTVMKFGL